MELPKTWQDFAIWFGMQFPVLAASVVIARWVVLAMNERHAADLKRTDDQHRRLLEEKDKQIAARDAQIAELKSEITFLRQRLYPSRRKDAGTGG